MVYNVLIVDDVPLNRKVIRSILKKMENMVFFEAGDGSMAMQCINKEDIDLVILDLMMPVKDGFEVLRELKASEKHISIPIIVYSALDDIENVHKALTMGAYDYFTKPLTADQIGIILPYKIKNALESYEQKKLLVKVNEKLEEEMRTIRYISFHDNLTGLYNRAFFEEELLRLDTDRQLPISLIIGDVNGLKFTNDVFGHQEGDKLLQKIAGILLESCRNEDVIARWGGDEFAIILSKTAYDSAIKICDRIVKACETAVKNTIQPNIALGCASKEKPSQDIKQVIKEAEDRMYHHKLVENRNERMNIINTLEKTVFERNLETREHIRRLTETVIDIGKAMGLGDNELDEIKLLSRFHDIGKITISSIFLKPGQLTPEEWEIVKNHSEIGYRIVRSCQEIAHISRYILCHHERWDGTGYPQGLKNEEIPKLSRIHLVADAFDVMTHPRPYRNAVDIKEALDEIKRYAGTQFDPEVAGVFLRMMDGREDIIVSS